MKSRKLGEDYTGFTPCEDDSKAIEELTCKICRMTADYVEIDAFESKEKMLIIYAALCRSLCRLGIVLSEKDRYDFFAEAIKITILYELNNNEEYYEDVRQKSKQYIEEVEESRKKPFKAFKKGK